jgi:hypothetical protein
MVTMISAFSCAILARTSIHIGMPAAASASTPKSSLMRDKAKRFAGTGVS